MKGDKTALQAISEARSLLVLRSPFFGCLSLHLKVVEIKDQNLFGMRPCETMATDGDHLYFWPPFVLGLSDPELQGVCAHEVMHCAYSHASRRGARDPYWWNVAADFRINFDLKEAGFILPGQAICWGKNPKGAKGHLYDPQFKVMTSEEIYEKIMQDRAAGKGFGNEQKDGDPSGCGIVIDTNSGPEKVKHSNADWEVIVKMAANIAKRVNAGKLPGYLERLVDFLDTPKINWRDQTRNFIDDTVKGDSTWSPPNRRLLSSGIIMPGKKSDTLRRIIMCIDVSGSITDEMMRNYVSEVAGALDDGVAERITVVYADTEVRQVDEFVQGDMVTCKTVGGGGTDFDDTFRWVKEHGEGAACVIYLTDMMTSSFGTDPGIPTLWAAYCPHEVLSHYKPPFGEVIQVSTG